MTHQRSHSACQRDPAHQAPRCRILLHYALVLGVGVIGLPMGFIPHVIFPDETGVLGFLCIWTGGTFWLATGLGWSLFMLGVTYRHTHQMVKHEDYAPYNFLTIFSDGFIGIWLLVLPFLFWRWGGFQKQT